MDGLTLGNNVDDRLAANSLEHEEGTEALVELGLARGVEERGAEGRELLGGDCDAYHFCYFLVWVWS